MNLAVQGFEVTFKSMGKHETDAFLYFFIGEALQADLDPLKVLDRVIVEGINQDLTKEPEHNLLIIYMDDTFDGTKRKFILERRVAAEQTNTTSYDHDIDIDIGKEIDKIKEINRINETTSIPFTTKIFETIKKFIDTIITSSKSKSIAASSQEAMEAGLLPPLAFSPSCSPSCSPSIASLITDSVTVSISETADSVSNVVSEKLHQERPQALDWFLGKSFTQMPKFTGHNLWHFKPKHLMMFKFVLLAYVVHRRYPYYSRLKNNCIMYATLIYDTAKRYGGNASPNTDPSELGCWKGFKVSRVNLQRITNIVTKFKRVLSRQLISVSLCSCLNYSH